MVTQVEIARRVGLDVSSVNKILNRTKGPVFNPRTIAKVERVARKMGYRPKVNSKVWLVKAIRDIEKALCHWRSDGYKTHVIREIVNRVLKNI